MDDSYYGSSSTSSNHHHGRSVTGAGTSESASAGCSLSERLRPKTRTNVASRSDLEGLAVFTWGRGEDGQLGLGDTSDQDEPTYCDALRGVGVRQVRAEGIIACVTNESLRCYFDRNHYRSCFPLTVVSFRRF